MHSVQADESIVFSRSSFSCSRLVRLRNFGNTFFLGGPLVGRKLQTHSSSFTLTPLHPLSRPRQTEHGHGRRNMNLFIIGLYYLEPWPCGQSVFTFSFTFRRSLEATLPTLCAFGQNLNLELQSVHTVSRCGSFTIHLVSTCRRLSKQRHVRLGSDDKIAGDFP
jgi:hypothetical protein